MRRRWGSIRLKECFLIFLVVILIIGMIYVYSRDSNSSFSYQIPVFTQNTGFNVVVKREIYEPSIYTDEEEDISLAFKEDSGQIEDVNETYSIPSTETDISETGVIARKSGFIPYVNFLLSPNPRFCSVASGKVAFIGIHSARSHFRTRILLRRTFGSVKSVGGRHFRTGFIIGKAANQTRKESKVDFLLRSEFELFGDIILGDFVDNYRNLSYKHLVGWQWALEYCAGADFYIKSDDDYLIEVFLLANLLSNISQWDHHFHCRRVSNWRPKRRLKSKYFVSSEEYGAKRYPPLCNGLYAVRMVTVKDIHAVRNQVNYLFLEDVFVTGILREVVNNNRGNQSRIQIRSGEVQSHTCHWVSTTKERIRKMQQIEIKTWRKAKLTCDYWETILAVHNISSFYQQCSPGNKIPEGFRDGVVKLVL